MAPVNNGRHQRVRRMVASQVPSSEALPRCEALLIRPHLATRVRLSRDASREEKKYRLIKILSSRKIHTSAHLWGLGTSESSNRDPPSVSSCAGEEHRRFGEKPFEMLVGRPTRLPSQDSFQRVVSVVPLTLAHIKKCGKLHSTDRACEGRFNGTTQKQSLFFTKRYELVANAALFGRCGVANLVRCSDTLTAGVDKTYV